MTDESQDFSARFIKANANLHFTADVFADVLRDLIRAAVADDPSGAAYRAAERMNLVADLLSATEEKFGFYALFLQALKSMESDREGTVVDDAIVRAARKGARFLVERSCHDNAARGRASKREDEFLAAVGRIEVVRDDFLAKY